MKTIRNTASGYEYKILESGEDGVENNLVMEVIYPAFSSEPFSHYHPYQTEYFKILQGELTVRMGGDLKVVRRNQEFIVPPNTDHSMWNGGVQKARVLWRVTPALKTVQFFETLALLANNGQTTGRGVPGFFESVILLHRFSDEIRVSGVPFLVQKFVLGFFYPFARLWSGNLVKDRRRI